MQKWWGLLFGGVIAACIALFVVSPFVPGWWLPKNISSFGGDVDNLFYFILLITGIFFVLTEGILVYNMFKFSNKPGQKADYSHGNHKLEMLWTFVPTLLLLIIAITQISAWEKIKYESHHKPGDVDQFVEVSARQFEWRIRYPLKAKPDALESWVKSGEADDVHMVNELHTWKGANVKVFLKTRDVIHSFFLPNLRLKQDALPGKTIPVWFDTTEANTKWEEESKTWKTTEVWELVCAELCGWGHYKMQGRLFVHETRADYEKWLNQTVEEQNSHK